MSKNVVTEYYNLVVSEYVNMVGKEEDIRTDRTYWVMKGIYDREGEEALKAQIDTWKEQWKKKFNK